MPKDIIRSNKHVKLYKPPSAIHAWTAPFVGALQRITGYQPPFEEKERVLDEIPKPDLAISPAKDE